MHLTEHYQKLNHAKQLIRKGLYICKTIKKLSLITGISRSTLQKMALKNFAGTSATRLRLEAFIEQNENKIGRPFSHKESN